MEPQQVEAQARGLSRREIETGKTETNVSSPSKETSYIKSATDNEPPFPAQYTHRLKLTELRKSEISALRTPMSQSKLSLLYRNAAT